MAGNPTKEQPSRRPMGAVLIAHGTAWATLVLTVGLLMGGTHPSDEFRDLLLSTSSVAIFGLSVVTLLGALVLAGTKRIPWWLVLVLVLSIAILHSAMFATFDFIANIHFADNPY